MLDSKEFGIIDNGYYNMKCFRADMCDDENKAMHSWIRARHECINGKLKTIRVSMMKFRHN